MTTVITIPMRKAWILILFMCAHRLKHPDSFHPAVPNSLARPATSENHLEGAFSCRVSKRVICLHDVVHREAMSHKLARLQFTGTYDLQQHWCGYGVHQPRCERNVTVPELLHVQFYWFAVDAHVGDASASRDNALANIEGSRAPDCLNGHVDASTLCQFHHLTSGVCIRAIDQSGCA